MMTASSNYNPPQAPPPPAPDNVQWLALLIREGLLVIVRGIERRYRLERK